MTRKLLCPLLLAGLSVGHAHGAVVATNPDTDVNINGGGFALTEEIGNVSLSALNASPDVFVLSYEESEGYANATGQPDPAADFTAPQTLQTVIIENTSGFNVFTEDAQFASSGDQASVSNGTVVIRFNTPVAIAAVMVNRNEAEQTVTVRRTGLDDEVFTLGTNNTDTGHSFFGFASDLANIEQLIFNQGSATNLRGFDDVAFSYQPIPEPASLALLGVGAALIVGRRRRG